MQGDGERQRGDAIAYDSVHLNGQGVILQTGALLTRLLDIPEKKLQGRALSEFITPDDRDRCRYAINMAFLGMPGRVGCTIENAEGKRHHIRCRFQQVAGGVEGELLVVDGNPMATPDRVSQQYNALIHALPGYIFVLDAKGRFSEMHPPESGELVFPPDFALRKHIHDLFPPPIAEATMAAIGAARRGEIAAFSYTLMMNGEERFFEAQGAASGEDEVVFIVIDRTTERQLEQHLRQHLRAERILTTITDRIMRSGSFSPVADDVLSLIGTMMEAERVSLVIITDEGVMRRLHGWDAPDISPLPQHEDNLPLTAFPWWTSQISIGKVVTIPDPDLLPESASAERMHLEKVGARSLIAFPISSPSGICGFIEVYNPADPLLWREEESRLLRIAGEIIGLTLAREKRFIQ